MFLKLLEFCLTYNLASLSPYLRNSIANACASLYKIDVFIAFSTRVRPPLRRERWSLFFLACILWMLFWWGCRMPGDTSNIFFLCLCSVVNELQHFADCHGCPGCPFFFCLLSWLSWSPPFCVQVAPMNSID
jgi:hypothetical protein